MRIFIHCSQWKLQHFKTSYSRRTLHSSLRTNGRSQTHGSSHKVRKHLVRCGRALRRVLLEVGDLQGRCRILRTGEGRLEFGTGIGHASLLTSGDGSRAGDGGGQLLTSAGAQERGGELLRHGCRIKCRGDRRGGVVHAIEGWQLRCGAWSGDWEVREESLASEARGFWR